MRKSGFSEAQIVKILNYQPADMGLTWESDSKLSVSLLADASVRELGPYDGWSSVVLRNSEPE